MKSHFRRDIIYQINHFRDYKAAELAHRFNVTTFWIQLFSKIGWAYDLKEPSAELVRKTIEKCGKNAIQWKFQKKNQII